MLVFAWLLLALSPWFDPGVTRPDPGPILAAGGVVALLAASPWRSPRRALPFLLLLVWWALCSRASLDPYRSELRLSSLTGGVGLGCMLLQRAQSRRAWRLTAHLMILIATALSLTGLGQPLLAATFSNPDSFCVLPLLGTLLAAGLAAGAEGGERAYLAFATAVLASAVILTGSRAGLLGLAVGILVLALRGAPRRTLAPFALGLVVLALIGGEVRLGPLIHGQDSQGVQMRRDVLVYGIRTAFHYAALGSGPGTFSLAYQEFRPVRPDSALPCRIYVNVAHDDFVEVAVETGFPGLVLWVGLQVAAGVAALRSRRMRSEATAALACLAALAVFSCLNFVLAVPVLLLWWFAVLGMAMALPHEPAELPRGVLPPVLMLAGMLAIGSGVRVTRCNGCLAEATRSAEGMRWEQALASLDQAVAAMPGRSHTYLERARILTNLRLLGESPGRDGGLDLLEAYRCSPRDPSVLRARTEDLCRQGRLERAERLLERAHRLMPYQDWVLEDLLRDQLLQARLTPACNTLRELSQRNEGYLDVLADLLAQHPEFGLERLDDWKTWAQVDKLAEKAARKQPAAYYPWLSLRHPDNLDYLLLASPYQSDPDASLERILESSPEEAPLYEKALIDWSNRSPTRIQRLLDFVESHPERLESRLALVDRVEPARARSLLADALARNGSDARLQARMGRILVKLGSPELARDYFARALQLDPSDAVSRADLNRLP